jgi:hypothetical protein
MENDEIAKLHGPAAGVISPTGLFERDSNNSCRGSDSGPEGLFRVMGVLVLGAEIELAEEFVEEVPVGGRMAVAVFAPPAVVLAGWLVG